MALITKIPRGVTTGGRRLRAVTRRRHITIPLRVRTVNASPSSVSSSYQTRPSPSTPARLTPIELAVQVSLRAEARPMLRPSRVHTGVNPTAGVAVHTTCGLWDIEYATSHCSPLGPARIVAGSGTDSLRQTSAKARLSIATKLPIRPSAPSQPSSSPSSSSLGDGEPKTAQCPATVWRISRSPRLGSQVRSHRTVPRSSVIHRRPLPFRRTPLVTEKTWTAEPAENSLTSRPLAASRMDSLPQVSRTYTWCITRGDRNNASIAVRERTSAT